MVGFVAHEKFLNLIKNKSILEKDPLEKAAKSKSLQLTNIIIFGSAWILKGIRTSLKNY